MNARTNALLLSSLLVLSAACSSSPTSGEASTDTHASKPSVPAAHQPLDGKVFDVVLVEANGGKQGPDMLAFDAAMFESSACRPYGFTAANYSAFAQGADVRFEAVAKSKDAGTNAWKGTVHGDSVRGTLTMTHPDGKTENATFEGKAARGSLDGSAFDVRMVGVDGKEQDKDHLTFAAGSFDSSSCRPFGFLRTAYTTTVDGDATKFEAVCASPEYGTNHWQGTIRGDRIEGTLKSGDPKGDTPTLHFAGSRSH